MSNTSIQEVYDAFLSKILEDEWTHWEDEEIEEDLFSIFNSALPYFKFPEHDITLDLETKTFASKLDSQEIEIIATYMKCEWLNRSIMTWENVRPLYDERDFSQANLIRKFSDLLKAERVKAKNLESLYYRSKDRKPFDFVKLSGK